MKSANQSILGRVWNRIRQSYSTSLRKRRNRRLESAEALEDRILLTTRLFLDLGEGFFDTPLTTTVGEFRNIDGAATAGTGSNLSGRGGLNNSSPLSFSPLNYDWDGDGSFELEDVQALAQAVLLIAQKEAEPLDIEVLLASSQTLDDARDSLHLNDAGGPDFNGFGENDAYNYIADISSGVSSVGFSTGLFGIAAASDLFAQNGNNLDEATLTFSDVILNSTSGIPGTDQFNANLAHRIAYTAVHEANHTYTLIHTDGSTVGQRQLTRGDAIRVGSDTREDRNIFTNFPLELQGSGVANTYGKMVNDSDIGFRDDNRNGIPDFAYVTGTGANDEITITDNGDLTATVVVDAFNNFGTFIDTFTYDISLTTDAEGLIVVDGSVGNDTITIDTNLPVGFEVRGHLGNDELILAGDPATEVVYDFGVNNQHEIEITRGGLTQVIRFDEELEEIDDSIQATDRQFLNPVSGSVMDVELTSVTTLEVITANTLVTTPMPTTGDLIIEANTVDGMVDLTSFTSFVQWDVAGDFIITGRSLEFGSFGTILNVTGDLTFNGNITRMSQQELIAQNITFNGTIDNISVMDLTVGTGGMILFNDQIGAGAGSVGTIRTGPLGTTHIGADITSIILEFDNVVTFDSGILLDSSTTRFAGSLNLEDHLLTIDGNVFFEPGSELLVDILGTSPGPGGFGQLSFFPLFSIGTSTTTLTVNSSGFNPSSTDTFTIINSTGAFRVSGEFTGLAEGATFLQPAFLANVTYQGGDGNDFEIGIASVAAKVDLANTVTAIDENTDTTNPLKVADVVIIDDDGVGTNVLSLSGPDAGMFTLVGRELFLNAGVNLDFETKNRFEVTVEVDDQTFGAVPDDMELLTIDINNVNETPVLSLENIALIPEDLDTTTSVKIADVRTIDVLGAHVFTITGPDAGLVEIVGSDPASWELHIRAGAALDFETNPTLDFTIEVDDVTLGVNPDDTLPVSLNVIDVNDPPTVELTNKLTDLDEDTDTSVPIKVADIVVSDDALTTPFGEFNSTIFTPGNLLVASFTSGMHSISEFDLSGNLIQEIPLTSGLDFAMAADGTLHFMDYLDTEQLRSVNPVTGVETVTSIPGWSVFDVIYFSGVGIYKNYLFGANQSFTSGGDGLVRIDLDNPSNFIDIPGPPTNDVAVGHDSLVYGLSSTAIGGIITVFDPETMTELDRFSLSHTDTIQAIGVDAHGNIYGASFDAAIKFDPTGAEIGRIDLPIRGISDVDLTSDGQSVVFTSNAGNFVVTDTAMTVSSTPGPIIGGRSFAALVQAPVGTGGNALALSGADAGLFEIVGNELFLRAGVSLDFETNPALDVTIEVNDPGVGADPDDTDTLQITIGDINEVPTDIDVANQVNPIAEGTDLTGGLFVADIVITDDALGTNNLTLSGADAGLFEIRGTQLFLQESAVLDFETQTQLNVTIEVQDADLSTTPDATVDVVFDITDTNEAATVVLTQTLFDIGEFADTSVAIKVADIEIQDDALGTNVLSLSGDDAGKFEIIGDELFIRAGATFDYETKTSLDVNVEVEDAEVDGVPDHSAPLSIDINDENDAPGLHLENIELAVPESPVPLVTPFKVADIVIDDDALGDETLKVSGTDRRFFEIVGTELFLKAGTVVDFFSKQRFSANVEVDDPTVGDGAFDTRIKVRLDVLNVNEPPEISNAAFTIPENSPAGLYVGNIPVSDRDPLDEHTFSITDGNTAGAFSIDNDGNITVNNPAAIDFEASPQFSLEVLVQDNGDPVADGSATITINLTNRVEGDAFLWDPTTKTLTLAEGNGRSFNFNNNTAGWDGFEGRFFVADVDGEDGDDIIGVSVTGDIMVSLNKSDGLTSPEVFGSWDPAHIGTDLNVGDFNGDGNADLIVRDLDGRWRYQLSAETSFRPNNGHKWGAGFRNGDALVLDYDGDGFDDVALVQATGQWYVGFGTETGDMETRYVGRWGALYGWLDLRSGDFNGDGRDDIIARTNRGNWYQLSTVYGTRRSQMTFLDHWNPNVNWKDVTIADFDGDGTDDFAGWDTNGFWYVNESSTNHSQQVLYGRWNRNGQWKVTSTDLDGNGTSDILGYDEATGGWWALLSDGSKFSSTTNFGYTTPASATQLHSGDLFN